MVDHVQRIDLFLDGVVATEHVINVGQVVGSRNQRVNATGRLEVLLEVSMLTELAHLRK